MSETPDLPTQEAEIADSQTLALEHASVARSLAGASAKDLTPQQARVHEVADALGPAYAKASQLEMTDAEIAALQAPFADEQVEVRPHDGLIWIPHIHISNRLNAVFRPGKWATICRRHWLEGATMYGEYVLVVRGCFVGESIGGHGYVPNNPKTNLSDALESTRAEALRRICGKTLGCGSQVWDPEYARRWVATYATQHNGKWAKKQSPQGTQSHPPVAQPPRQSGPPTPRQAAAAPPPSSNVVKPIASNPPVGHICPKCRATASKESKEWDGMRWCQKCGWQWEEVSGEYFEGHAWNYVICTRPPKGMKLDEYRKAPQTLGQIARLDSKRWYGLVKNSSEAESAKGYTSPASGKHYPASDAELAFGRACDQANAYLEAEKAKQGGAGEERVPEPPDDWPEADIIP